MSSDVQVLIYKFSFSLTIHRADEKATSVVKITGFVSLLCILMSCHRVLSVYLSVVPCLSNLLGPVCRCDKMRARLGPHEVG